MKATYIVTAIILALTVTNESFAQSVSSSGGMEMSFASTAPGYAEGWDSGGGLLNDSEVGRIQPVDVREKSRANAMSAAYETVCSLILDAFYKMRREAADGESVLSSLPLSIQADGMDDGVGLMARLTDKWAVSVTNKRSFDIRYSLPGTGGKISLATDNFENAMIGFSLGL